MAHGAGGASARVTTIASDAATSIADRVREAAAHRQPLRIAAAGSWLDAGRSVAGAAPLSIRELAGIVEYVPGDLTLTARAGTTLAEIKEATSANNQWLALDPYGTDDGTIGATTATASAGPLATAFGTPRDLLLGVEFVTGTGAVARGGGKVVKNVAGFDLTRLMTGSWGTLGVITEVTVRLHARPVVDRSFAIELGNGDIDRLRMLLRRVPFRPYACELLNEALARQLLNRVATLALFRLGGNAEAVEGQRTALAALGDAVEVDGDVWTKLRGSEAAGAAVFRLSDLPSHIERTWGEAAKVKGALVHAAPLRGIVRVIADRDASVSIEQLLRRRVSNVIGERMTPQLWSALPAAAADNLSTRIKSTFDPSNVLNPGILGGAA